MPANPIKYGQTREGKAHGEIVALRAQVAELVSALAEVRGTLAWCGRNHPIPKDRLVSSLRLADAAIGKFNGVK